jgi:hypothetical protein
LRQHLEHIGFDIVANLGDQFSDLRGGFAGHPVKVPNPMYFQFGRAAPRGSVEKVGGRC